MEISSKQSQTVRSVTSSSYNGTEKLSLDCKTSFAQSTDFEMLEKQLDFLRNDRQKLLQESRVAMEQQCDTNHDLRQMMKTYKSEAEACRKVSNNSHVNISHANRIQCDIRFTLHRMCY